MRVIQVIGSRGGGGAERFYVRLAKALQQAGVAVLTLHPPDSFVARELGPAVDQHLLPMRGVWDLLARQRIRRLARRFDADIVQTWMGRATRLTHLPAGRRPVHLARLGGYYDLRGYRHAHAWVGNTRGIRDHLIAGGLPSQRVFHIGNFVEPAAPVDGASLAALRARLGLPPAARVILGLGRLHPNKGFADLLAAFDRLPATIHGQPLHLLIVGDGPLRDALRRQGDGLAAAPRIHWAGWTQDPRPYYRLAELFVCPSRHEPLGNVILEAWQQGLPVIATASAGARELMASGQGGRLVPVADPAALARSLHELLDQPGMLARLGREGQALLARHHSAEVVVADYLRCYESLLASCT